MYIPDKYKVTDPEEAKAFIKEFSFGILISNTNSKLWGTHLPFQIETNAEGKKVLQGHIAKRNPQWKDFGNDEKVMVIFNGPHTYISSSWYDYEEVPTWNYLAVHVYGKIRKIEGEELWNHMKSLVDRYESDSKNPIEIESLSEKTMAQMKAVVGLEVTIDEIHAVKKISQEKSASNQKSIIDQLHDRNDDGAKSIAEYMQNKKQS